MKRGSKIYTKRLPAKIMNNRFNRTDYTKRRLFCAVFIFTTMYRDMVRLK